MSSSQTYKADIIIGDKSPEELRLLTNILCQQGYRVRQALDGEMLSIACKTRKPDLIIVDLQLPYIKGADIGEQLRSDPITESIPLFFITSLDDSISKNKAFDYDAIDCLRKPYNVNELVSKVKLYTSYREKIKNLEGKVKQLEQQLELSELLPSKDSRLSLGILKSAIEAVHNGIVIVDATTPDYPIIYVNRGFELMTGYSAGEVIGKNCRFLQRKEIDQPGIRELRQAVADKSPCCVTLRNFRKDGSLFWNEISLSPILNNAGEVIYYIGVQTDISDRQRSQEELERSRASIKKMNQELHRLTNLDGLTGIANQRCFDETLETEWQRCSRERLPLALILLDIDFFKPFNDTYGHLRGDDCLKTVASALNRCVQRGTDLAARCGGEEFAVILPNTTADEALKVAGEIQEELKNLKITHESSRVSDRVTMSIGIATEIPQPGLSAKDLRNSADQALYLAKEQGRDRIVIYQSLINNS
ncbi:MAG: diguanylate cyclase [Chlorogloea purpurea SAG 13.99]|nr:diguanylate cyclase [Chlorogloea purpurea SAG 13.99]